jgi:hypothetical protein
MKKFKAAEGGPGMVVNVSNRQARLLTSTLAGEGAGERGLYGCGRED